MKQRRSAVKIIAGLIGLVKPMLLIMAAAVLLGTLGHLAAISIPVGATIGVLTASGYDTGVSISAICTVIIIAGILRGLLRYGEQACNHYIAFRILAEIRDRVFAALRRLAPAKLDGRGKGDLISIITSDVELLEVFYAHTISPVMIALLVSVCSVAFMCRYSVSAGIIAAAAYVVIGAVLPVINSRKSAKAGVEYRDGAGELNTVFLDALRGLGELIQYDKTAMRRDEINALTDKLGTLHKSLKRSEIFALNVTDIAIFAFDLMMIISQAALYSAGKIGFDAALICSVALISSFGPVTALANLSVTLSETLASGERVLSLLEEVPQTEDITDGIDAVLDEVKCENVSFSYGGERVLDNIDFSAKPNAITGIYGKSGSGKSTLLKLIMRFWDADGRIMLSGYDIRTLNTEALRKSESYCTQETYLFNDTIGNNIRIAKPSATDDEVKAAAQAASLHEFVSELTNGYDTPVGELGGRLSGGERQRIGLARAFLSGAPIMLLDEPTSNLDSLNEAVILKSLSEVEGKTVILVSHRKSTLAVADRIYALETGRNS